MYLKQKNKSTVEQLLRTPGKMHIHHLQDEQDKKKNCFTVVLAQFCAGQKSTVKALWGIGQERNTGLNINLYKTIKTSFTSHLIDKKRERIKQAEYLQGW